MSQSYDFTFVTYSDLPELDPDDRLALNVLIAQGFKCTYADWRNIEFDWLNAGKCVLRSTWDYHLHYSQFLAFCKSLGNRLVNNFSLVEWNSDKTYMLELEQKKIAIVPSIMALKGEPLEELPPCEWQTVIVKPTIGLATYGVKKFSLPRQIDEYRVHMRELCQKHAVLIQKFMPEVMEYGERSLMYFNGEYSHAVRKSPFQALAHAGGAGEEAAKASNEEVAFGHKVLNTLETTPVYARVDIVPGDNGKPLLMELELVEPSLFLGFESGAAERFAEALKNAVPQGIG